MKSIIKKAVSFHGHLGPFLIIGIKMGLIAKRKLKSRSHFDMYVIAMTGTKPPISCIVDGIQISTGCTLGKGNIKVLSKYQPKAIFVKNRKKLKIELKKDVFKLINKGKSKKIIDRIIKSNDKKLFNISEQH
jgi:formylmethanofuran dehydrogenase subunit E